MYLRDTGLVGGIKGSGQLVFFLGARLGWIPFVFLSWREGPDETPTTATRPVAPTAFNPVTYVDEGLYLSCSEPVLLRVQTLVNATLAPTFPVDKFVFFSLNEGVFVDLAGDAPRTRTVVGTPTPVEGVGVIFVMEGSLTYIRRPAMDPDDVAAVSFDTLPTIFTDHIILPSSFEELPGGGVPEEKEPSKAVGIMEDDPVVKGDVHSI